jgi:hypothetical protein
MKALIESARRATEAAKRRVAKVRERFQFGQPEFEMADDALLAAGLAAKRLRELGEFLESGRPAPGPTLQ